jgi:hypothetical protein
MTGARVFGEMRMPIDRAGYTLVSPNPRRDVQESVTRTAHPPLFLVVFARLGDSRSTVRVVIPVLTLRARLFTSALPRSIGRSAYGRISCKAP